MKNPKKHFPRILRIEMEDLKEDLEDMIQKTREDFESGRISERVHKENTQLFKNEIIGVIEFSNIIVETQPDDFESLEALIDHLKSRFRSSAVSHALANAVIICVERKMDKALNYVSRKSTLHF